jgi:hypothetical protein
LQLVERQIRNRFLVTFQKKNEEKPKTLRQFGVRPVAHGDGQWVRLAGGSVCQSY